MTKKIMRYISANAIVKYHFKRYYSATITIFGKKVRVTGKTRLEALQNLCNKIMQPGSLYKYFSDLLNYNLN